MAERLGYLLAAAYERVQRRHRLLKDHRDAAPTYRAHYLFIRPQQLNTRLTVRQIQHRCAAYEASSRCTGRQIQQAQQCK
jgi:hypothetical protein